MATFFFSGAQKAVPDRRRWLWWLLEAKKQFVLCILNYAITSREGHRVAHENRRFYSFKDIL